MSGALAVAAAVLVLGALAVAALAVRRGGMLPIGRLLAMAAAGAAVTAAATALSRALLAAPLEPAGGAASGVLATPAFVILLALAAVTAACLVLGLRGDALASPSAGAGLGLAFALGGVLGGPLVAAVRGQAAVRELLLHAAVGAAFAAVLGAFAGASRLQAMLPVRAALLAGGVVLGGAAAGGVFLAFAGVSSRSAAAAVAAGVVAALAVIALAGGLAWILERRIVRRELDEEASLGVLPDRIPPVIASWRGVTGDDWWPRRDERWAIVELLTQLAYRKHQLRQLDGDHAAIYSLEVGRLRERARRVLAYRPERADRPGEDEV